MNRTLILERLLWETGGAEQQIQIPTDAFRQFFMESGSYTISVFKDRGASTPIRERLCLVSAYWQSSTFRINSLPEVSSLAESFLFFTRPTDKLKLDFWWSRNLDKVVEEFGPFRRAKASQYGPGRRWKVLEPGLKRV